MLVGSGFNLFIILVHFEKFLGTFYEIKISNIFLKIVSSRYLVTLRLGLLIGFLFFVCRLNRGNQSYSFPILLCEELMPSPVLYATVTPIVAWVLLSKFVIEPFQRDQRNRHKEKQREANKTRLVYFKNS